MVRPLKFERADVENALLDVFWSRGYAGASIEEITEATGLLRGSLYSSYGSKEDMYCVAVGRYVDLLTAAFVTKKTGLEAIAHVLDTVVRLTLRDPERRGCLILNTIPESYALSSETQTMLQRELNTMPALLLAHLERAQTDAGTDLDLEPLVAMMFAASVSIRVLGRAAQNRRLLKNIAKGALEAAERSFRAETE